MKVLVSCVESGSLREYLFTKDTDTSDPDSPKPESKTFLAEKLNPVVKFILTKHGLVIARKKGHLGLYNSEYEHIKDILDCPGLVGLDATEDSLYIVDKEGSGTIYDFGTGETRSFTLPGDLSVAVKHPTQDLVLCSGAELRPEIHTLDGQVVFQAKNPKAKLDLPEKNLVTNACFLPSTKQDEFRFATVTSHGKVRTYDTAQAKKPISQEQVSKFSLKALACHEEKLIVGDTQSKVGLYQFNPVKLLGFYKGIVGGTSSVTSRKDLICTVGLDRYIRIFNGTTREANGKVFVGEELLWAEILQDDDEKRALDEDEFWDDINNANKKQKSGKGPKEQEQEELSEDLSSDSAASEDLPSDSEDNWESVSQSDSDDSE